MQACQAAGPWLWYLISAPPVAHRAHKISMIMSLIFSAEGWRTIYITAVSVARGQRKFSVLLKYGAAEGVILGDYCWF